MANDDDSVVMVDVEEGEISDSASVEEITGADFAKQGENASSSSTVVVGDGGAKGGSNGSNARVWTMHDLLTKYPGCRGYATSGLYNFAWAQAVQNKPLNEALRMEMESSENGKGSSQGKSSEGDKIVIIDSGDEKEEGELEEGEIDLESVQDDKLSIIGTQIETEADTADEANGIQTDSKEKDLEKRSKSIRAILESTSLVEAHTAFEGVCSKLLGALDSLKELITEHDDFPKRETLIQLAFAALQTVNSVFSSMNNASKELNKETMAKLLSLVNNHFSRLLSSNQIKEIDSMIQWLNANTTFFDRITNENNSVLAADFGLCDSVNATTKRGTSNFRSKMPLHPLLDLHKDHDEDSLPSPTRETTTTTTTTTTTNGSYAMKPAVSKPGFPVGNKPLNDAKIYPYESDAIKAVSSYQQKFGSGSVFKTDDLPSPTPSDDSNNGNCDIITGEISSSKQMNLAVTSVPDVPLPSNLPLKPNAKNRDPRLRFANPDNANQVGSLPKPETSGSSKKQKASDEILVEGIASKRQKKNSLETNGIVKDSSSELPLISKSGADVKTAENGTTSETSSLLLPSFLKDIAVNPTMLLNFLKMGERQRVAETVPQKPTDPRRAAQLPGSSAPLAVSPPALSPVGPAHDSAPSDESGKIRMKPRDPRRILHGNTLQTIGTKEEKPETKSGISNNIQKIPNNNTKKKTGEILTPDISSQFTKNLKNIADVVSVSQAPPPSPSPAAAAAQLASVKTTSEQQRGMSVSASVTAAAGPARSMTSWGDVEHLFEGYDEKQKSAIQRERARRLEEQMKMFASRKLCLVLDLDHTLLNSAKFNEVDPVHDELLRKKEEQDREKSCRHLFRFPHMAMWTKLRPGVWNFLDKASKLYELHLYTMGNKLYATEMAKVLDPKGVLFNGRVISRGDDEDPVDGEERVPKSKDLEGVLGMESAVVIIDDSVRVWPHNKLNLIVVERYTYFPCSRRQFGLLGPSLLEIDHDERPEDGTLASSLAVIERIHKKFYSEGRIEEADVRNILAREQQKILGGCRIVFSRVFPVGEAHPHLHPLWQTAEQFGAVCTTLLDDLVTHVVANSLGTDKVNWALSKGKFVVHPGWVEASALLYRRANENDFAIKP